jgi:hypothetical protein
MPLRMDHEISKSGVHVQAMPGNRRQEQLIVHVSRRNVHLTQIGIHAWPQSATNYCLATRGVQVEAHEYRMKVGSTFGQFALLDC